VAGKPLEDKYTEPLVGASDKEPHLIGYARISMSDQSPQLQFDALKAHGIPEDRIYYDQKSGSGVKREAFELMMKDARAGDVIVVWKLDRLGRSTREVLNTFFELEARGAKLRVLTQPWMDTTGAMGNFFISVMAAFAELEKNMISERTKAGLAAARARGRIGGRTSKVVDKDILALANLGTSRAAARLGMSKSGFIKRLKQAQERAGDASSVKPNAEGASA
jgi:DNA invertase Pin-like site-specific DNA recombinase